MMFNDFNVLKKKKNQNLRRVINLRVIITFNTRFRGICK